MNFLKSLEKISEENNVNMKEVMDNFNKLNEKLYSRDYGKFLNEINDKIINILERYYKMK